MTLLNLIKTRSKNRTTASPAQLGGDVLSTVSQNPVICYGSPSQEKILTLSFNSPAAKYFLLKLSHTSLQMIKKYEKTSLSI